MIHRSTRHGGARALLALLLGAVLSLLALEGGLRAWAWSWTTWHRWRNAPPESHVVVYCLGESTTAFGREMSYPSQLEGILNEKASGRRFSVVNGGRPGVDSSILVDGLPAELDRVRPQVLVAMMGANDGVPRAAGTAVPWASDTVFSRPSALRLGRLVALVARERARRRAEGTRLAHAHRWHPPACQEPSPPCREVVSAWDVVAGGDPDRGQRMLEKAAATSAIARVELGVLLSQRDRGAEAIAAFQAASQDPAAATAARVEWGGYLLSQRRLDEARPVLQEATVRDPSSAPAWAALGEVAYFAQDCPNALRAMEQAHRLQPRQPRVLEVLGACWGEQGRDDLALPLALEAVALWDGSYWFGSVLPRIRVTDVLERAGRTDEIRAWLTRAVTLLPDEESAPAALAAFEERHGNAAQAARWQAEAQRRRQASFRPMTRESYGRLLALLRGRGVRLVAMQYPRRPLAALQALFSDTDGITFVDNEADFEAALRTRPFRELFTDDCYNDFGHGTALGNRILAQNAAEGVLQGE